MRLGVNKSSIVLKLIVIILAATVIYHSLDMSFECQLARSWALSFTWAGLLDQVIDTVIFIGLYAAIASILQSLRRLLNRAIAWISLCRMADQNISPIAFSMGGHAPPAA